MAAKANLAVILLGLLMISALDFTVAQTGVCFGMLGGSLPSPAQVVDLYNRNNIRRMRIYDPNQATLQALAGSSIELMIGVSNTDLPSIAASQDGANDWVRNNVLNHPSVRFRYIAVGNEVSPLRESRQYLSVLLPALRNIHTAISAAGLRIPVSTAIDFGLFENTFPPSNGAFRADVISFVDPILRFLAGTQAPMLLNLYPYFAHTENRGSVDLQYALFASQEGVTTSDGTRYQNLFYAMLDAAYAAVARRGIPSSLNIVVSESGWPSAGDPAATLDNARTYNTNLVRAVRSGTPRRPGPIETYVFAMFDEDRKDPEIERNFGLFRPNQQSKYPISFA